MVGREEREERDENGEERGRLREGKRKGEGGESERDSSVPVHALYRGGGDWRDDRSARRVAMRNVDGTLLRVAVLLYTRACGVRRPSRWRWRRHVFAPRDRRRRRVLTSPLRGGTLSIGPGCTSPLLMLRLLTARRHVIVGPKFHPSNPNT